ncbi:MAG TPA: HD domain-containing phosphohydrolase [Patescibacteria group bacterium]|nr:HD domain-containing phosphohydrolase [Patescibacteria group bacterium]
MIELYTNELVDGMILASPVTCPQTGNLLLSYGTRLTEDYIQLLRGRGIPCVSVTERYTLFTEPCDTIRGELRDSLDREIIRMAPEKLEGNTSDSMVAVSRKARDVAAQLVEDHELVHFCVGMKILDNDYIFQHCIHTCALALLVAGAMDMSGEDMFDVGAGALLHDLGLCEMPGLLRVSGRSSQEEALWREHPRYGYYFAKEAGFKEEICRMVHFHHEHWNGTGYPQGMSGEQIPLGARIIAVCDKYDDLLRHQKYPHYQAVEFLYGAGNIYFDMDVIRYFTNSLAVYPLGSMVRLTTKEVGVVVNVRDNLGPRPVVRVYYNRVNRPLSAPRDVDLGRERTVFIEEIL